MFDDLQDVVQIQDAVYAKTPVALEAVLARLRAIGYQVDSLRDPEYQRRLGTLSTSIETRENGRFVLWSAHLDARRGKCSSCQRYIKMEGIESHGHRCEHCNSVTYEEIVDGTTVQFSFISRQEDDEFMVLTMKAKRWDTETGTLYLSYETLDSRRGKAAAQEHLKKHTDKWQGVEEDGQQLIRVRRTVSYDRANSDIEVSDIQGRRRNHRVVQVWKGKEYQEHDPNFPHPTSLSIYEAWRWAPLPPSPQLHKTILAVVGATADKGYYHQDGRPYFNANAFQSMGVFIRHFTTLDADKWDRCSSRFPLDAPSAIDNIARFCHSSPDIEDHPNVGNFIAGLSKGARGAPLSARELTTFADAIKDPAEGRKVIALLMKLWKR